MKKAHLVALGCAATLGFAGWGHAAAVPLRQAMPLGQPQTAVFVLGAEPGASPHAGQFQFAIDPAWGEPGPKPDFAAAPAAGGRGHAPVIAVGGSDTGKAPPGRPQTELPAQHNSPFYAYLMSAGQYVLDVGTLSDQYSAGSRISAVPLPGALWLFASALVAFLGISGRRKL